MTLAHVFYCEFCEISKDNFFYRIPPDDCFCYFTQTKLMICDKFLIMVKSRSTITFVILTLSWCLQLGKIFHLMTDTFLIIILTHVHYAALKLVFYCPLAWRCTLRSEIIFSSWKLFKNNEKYFLFNLKSSFRSQDIQVFALTFLSLLFLTWQPITHF